MAALAGALDGIRHGRGFAVAAGWVAAPRGRPWPTVRLRLGGLVLPIATWFTRADLPDDPAGPEHRGFIEDLPWPDAVPPGAAAVLEANGAALAVLPEGPWPPFTPEAHLDAVSQAGIVGWAFHPALWHAAGRLELALDGAPLAPLPLAVPRPDLPHGPARRGRPLGFVLSPAALGAALAGRRPFGDGAAHRWSVLADGREAAHWAGALPALSDAGLSGHDGAALRGHARLPGHPGEALLVEVRLAGTRFATLAAAPGQPAPGGGDHGFALGLRFSPTGGALRVSAHVAGEARPLPGTPATLRLPAAPAGDEAAPWRALAGGWPRVTILVPAHGAPDALGACLASVLGCTRGAARLLVWDDATPGDALAPVLAPLRGRAGVELRANPRNLGFTATCNLGIAAAGRDDVVLLNSDTEVGEGWLERLVQAAHASPLTGSATPFGDRAGAFSADDEGGPDPSPAGASVTDAARRALQAARPPWPEAPTGHGFCLYLRRAMLDATGPLDEAAFPRGYGEENDLCRRGALLGWRHVVDPRVLVRHRQAASFGAARDGLLRAGLAAMEARHPGYPTLTRGFAASEAMAAARWRLRRAPRTRPRPRTLFVIGPEGGGTALTNLDLMRALEGLREPWLLRSDGARLALLRMAGGRLHAVEEATPAEPLSPAHPRSEAWDAAVAALLLRHGIELVHVRHLAFHSLGLPGVARALGLPVVLSLHDYHLACPAVKLLDPQGRFCGGRCTEGEGDCAGELWPPGSLPPLRGRFAPGWRALTAPAILAADALVTTSAAARAVLRGALPALAGREVAVIPHGRDFPALRPPATRAPAQGRLRVLVPGLLSEAKGAGLVQAMAALDGGRTMEFHLLGTPGPAAPGLVPHGPYGRDDFVARAAAIRPHLGLLPSRWPETWCHALTELWAAGLPVLGLDTGAVGERIAATGAGWLAPPAVAPDALLARLRAAAADAQGFRARLDALRRWQDGEGAAQGTAAMAAAWEGLYVRVQAARLSFPSEPPA